MPASLVLLPNPRCPRFALLLPCSTDGPHPPRDMHHTHTAHAPLTRHTPHRAPRVQGERVWTAMRYDPRSPTEIRSRLRLRSTAPGANNRLDIQAIVSWDREEGQALPMMGERGGRTCCCAPNRRLPLFICSAAPEAVRVCVVMVVVCVCVDVAPPAIWWSGAAVGVSYGWQEEASPARRRPCPAAADLQPDEEAAEGAELQQHRRGMSTYVFGGWRLAPAV